MAKRRARKLPDILTQEEQEALLSQPNRKCPTGYRNYLMLRIMLNCGLRCAEAINLQFDDINLMTGRLIVRQGKGSKDRILWLNEDDLKLIQEWREKVPSSSPHVFATLKGTKLQPAYVRAMVRRLGAKAGLKKRVYPHLLRHSMASDLYRQSKDIRLVQRVLGHSSISTTQVYTHLVDEDVERALKDFRSAKAG